MISSEQSTVAQWSYGQGFKPLKAAYATHPDASSPRCNLHVRSYVESHSV